MLDSVLVGPSVRGELSGKEDFLAFLEEIPWDALLVVVELLLEDDAAEEARGLVVLLDLLVILHNCIGLMIERQFITTVLPSRDSRDVKQTEGERG